MTVGSGKTVQSGPNDHIFVFYSDHGSPGLVSFVHDTLYATDLNNVSPIHIFLFLAQGHVPFCSRYTKGAATRAAKEWVDSYASHS